MLRGYLLLAASAFTLGAANFIYPRASRALGGTNATFYYYLCALAVALLYWLPTREARQMRLVDWQWPFCLALAMFISNLTYSYGVRYFDTALPAVIRALSFFGTAFLVVFLEPRARLLGQGLAGAATGGGWHRALRLRPPSLAVSDFLPPPALALFPFSPQSPVEAIAEQDGDSAPAYSHEQPAVSVHCAPPAFAGDSRPGAPLASTPGTLRSGSAG